MSASGARRPQRKTFYALVGWAAWRVGRATSAGSSASPDASARARRVEHRVDVRQVGVRAATPLRPSRRRGSGTPSESRRRSSRAARTRRRTRESPRRSSRRGAGRRPRASAPTRDATTANRARSRTAGYPPPPGRRPCHAGGAARSFRSATSPRRRSRGASSPRRERLAAASTPRGCRPDLDVGNRRAGFEHTARLIAGYGAS